MSGIPLAGKLKVNTESYRNCGRVPWNERVQPCWNQLPPQVAQWEARAVKRQVGLDLRWSLPLATSA